MPEIQPDADVCDEYDVAVVGAGPQASQQLARTALGQFSRGRKFLDTLFAPAPDG